MGGKTITAHLTHVITTHYYIRQICDKNGNTLTKCPTKVWLQPSIPYKSARVILERERTNLAVVGNGDLIWRYFLFSISLSILFCQMLQLRYSACFCLEQIFLPFETTELNNRRVSLNSFCFRFIVSSLLLQAIFEFSNRYFPVYLGSTFRSKNIRHFLRKNILIYLLTILSLLLKKFSSRYLDYLSHKAANFSADSHHGRIVAKSHKDASFHQSWMEIQANKEDQQKKSNNPISLSFLFTY